MKLNFPGYGYANARVKAMKTKLLDSNKTRQLQDVGSIDEMVALLEETPYKQDMVEASAEFKGIRLVTSALHANLTKTMKRVYTYLPADGREAFELVWSEWEATDLKKILAAKATGAKIEEGELTNVFDNAVVSKALAARDLKDAVAEIKGCPDYEKAFADQQLKELAKNGDYRPLLVALDDCSLRRLAELSKKTKSRHLKKVIGSRLGFRNTMLILRMLRDGLPKNEIESRLLPAADKRWSTDLLSGNYEAAVKKAAKKFKVAESVAAQAIDEKKLGAFEIAVEKKMVSDLLRESRLSVLEFGTILSFMYLKTVEVENIRKIAYGIHFGLRDELKQTIIPVN